jgi:hypothetical protein
MAHCSATGPFSHLEGFFARIAIIRIDTETMTGKHHD